MKKIKFHPTIIGSALIIVALAALITVGLVVKNSYDRIASDNRSKTAINAIYYSLENVYYASNGYYPSEVNSAILSSVDSKLLKDSNGIEINSVGSDYTYTPINCKNDKCKNYTLKAHLNNEADYIKTGLHQD